MVLFHRVLADAGGSTKRVKEGALLYLNEISKNKRVSLIFKVCVLNCLSVLKRWFKFSYLLSVWLTLIYKCIRLFDEF